jgi:hypothetical protein
MHTGVWPQFIGCRVQCHDGEDDMAAHEQKYLRFKVQTNTTRDMRMIWQHISKNIFSLKYKLTQHNT